LSRLANFESRAPTVQETRGRALVSNMQGSARTQLRPLVDGGSSVSAPFRRWKQKTDHRSVVGFPAPLWAVPAGRRARLFSHRRGPFGRRFADL